MLLQLKLLLVKGLFLVFRLADKVASIFGIKIFKINHQNVFSGLSMEEVQEAQHPDIVTPFSLFIHGAQMDDQLDGIARFNQIQYLKSVLVKRAGIKKAIADNPDILKTPIKRPVFIIGFPRTGTTLLFHLMSQDEQFRFTYFWEIINPYPAGRPDNWQECSRFNSCKRLLQLRRAVGEGDFDVAHELRADHPEECLFILGRSFLLFHYFTRLLGFKALGEWFYNLTRKQFGNIYRYYKEQLQLIGYKGLDKQSYLLKAHVHLISLDALLDVFPDACLVFTYRPLTEIIPSFCSTVEMGTSGWGPKDANYGKRILHLISKFANRGVETMKRCENLPQDQQPFLNVEYQDLVKNPIETVREIYKQYGFTLTMETEEKMEAYLAKNKQHRHGKHHYSMEQYGLTEKDITDNFGPYLDYFKDKAKCKLI